VADGSQAWIGAPIKAAAMFLIVVRSGLRGRGTLEEGGPDVVVRCNNMVGTWLVRDARVDQFDEEEQRDEEEDGDGVMIRCVRECEEQDGEEGCQEGECLPSADFGGADHRWIECIAQVWCHDDGMV
jgi:hypothetical protein